jgi:CDP-glucose 4,6-dehydratase
VLLTGHTGLKGAWLRRQGHWLSLPAATQPNLFSLIGVHELIGSHHGDIRDTAVVTTCLSNVRLDIVFHLAAQALVHSSYRDPLTTFSTNVLGTANVLNSLLASNTARVAVAITTGKVYQKLKNSYPYRETDAVGVHVPYSASKAASEIVIASFRDSYLTNDGVAIASARACNLIGGGDLSEDRLIPDAVMAWSTGKPLEIRRPQSVRAWQYVLEPLPGYLRLAERLWVQPSLTGPTALGLIPAKRHRCERWLSLLKKRTVAVKSHLATALHGPMKRAGWHLKLLKPNNFSMCRRVGCWHKLCNVR